MARFGGTGVLLSLSVVLCASSGRAEPPGRKAAQAEAAAARQAMALHDEAAVLYEQGSYRAAIDKLEAALRLDPKGAELVYNLALIHERLGDFEAAERYYLRYLEMDIDAAARARVQGILRRLSGARKELHVAGPAPRPGQPLEAAPPLLVVPPPRAPSRPIRPVVWLTGGVAVAGLVVGSALAINAVARNPGNSAMTGGSTSIADLQADAHAAHQSAVGADVSIILGLVAAGAAAIFYATTDPTPSGEARSPLRVTF